MSGDRLRGGVFHASDGTRLSYIEEGAGPTVVFLHGGLGRGSNWINVADQLRDRYRCVMLDRRAHGNSDWGGGPDLDAEASDVLGLIELVGPATAVVGHSYGSLVALRAAVTDPAAVSRLVLYEPPLSIPTPIMAPDVIASVRALEQDGAYEEVLLTHLGSASGGLTATEIDNFRTNPMFRAMYADLVMQAPSVAPGAAVAVELNSAEPYADVIVPTAILLGTESSEHPFRTSAEALAATMPNATVVPLEGQTHMALLLAPHLVAAAAAAFLAA